jgi:hypothetical protein
MNDKLQRLSINMVDLFPQDYFDSPQQCFDTFTQIYGKQYEYFGNFEAHSLIKLVFNIYSYKNTKGFKLSDEMMSKLGFASLFITEGNYRFMECPSCNGVGAFACSSCQGEGAIDCPACNYGQIQCETCDGDGIDDEEKCKSCGGDGQIQCDTCGGDDKLTCRDCNGTGEDECQKCDGMGDVQTEEYQFDYYVIATWDNFIKDNCELRAGTMEPALSEYDFDRLKDNYIILEYDELSQEFPSIIDPNEIYCTAYDDEPILYKSKSKHLQFWFDDNNLEYYLA